MKANIEYIKTLRNRTQASYMACKEALLNSQNIFEAEKYLTKKGLRIIDSAPADQGQQGIVKAYVHPGDRICAAVEVGCETDFVAKTEEFQNFAKEMALQVASMKPRVISRSDVTFEEETKEMSFRIERLKKEGYEDEELEKALFAEMEQWFTEVCLLEQTYIRDAKKSVKDLLAELISKTQENCKVRRIIRWEVGSSIEKQEDEGPAPVTLLTRLRPYAIATLVIVLLFTFLAFCGVI